MAPKDYSPEISDTVSRDVTSTSFSKTNTGLDGIIDAILVDPGLNLRIPSSEIAAGAKAAAVMNQIIVEAIKATGVANDGDLTPADMASISDWIQANRSAEWVVAHGDDEDDAETGFHLVQNDGATLTAFGNNLTNTVADGLYHLGFGYSNGRITNEDGAANASLEDLANWLSEVLEDDLAAGTLANTAVDAEPAGTTGTGMDSLIAAIFDDKGLQLHVTLPEIQEATAAANTMNAIIVEAIKALGVANDGTLSASDIARISDYIKDNHSAEWIVAHGDDADGVETGFHLVQNDCSESRMFGDAGIDQVADGIFHLGFGHSGGRLINEDGNGNASLREVAGWLNSLLADDLESGALANPAVSPLPAGTTGTGLDGLVDLINEDEGLEQRVALGERAEGAEAADTMNNIIIDGIKALGLADDGVLEPSEIYELSDWIKNNHAAKWAKAHGDDEKNVETGFHLVQNDGDEGSAFGRSAVDTVADAIYHLGFGHKGDRLINEDGNTNERVEEVTHWLSELLSEDLADGSLVTGNSDRVAGSTGTGLDQLITLITNEGELNRRVSKDEIEEGAAAADGMNQIIIDAIKATGIANNGEISAADIMEISDWIKTNEKAAWTALHGDDENTSETGFHLVQNDGAVERLYSENGVNTVADGLFHLGFGYSSGRLINEDGNGNATLENVAHWLEELLVDDLADGSLANGELDPYPMGSTGTGLDQMVQAVVTDPGLTHRIPTSQLTEIANFADQLNGILLEGIEATGIANNGFISQMDIVVLDQWISENKLAEWDKLAGEHGGDSGILGLVWCNGVTQILGENAFNDIGRALYSLGHGVKWGGVRDADGDYAGSTDMVLRALNGLLEETLDDGDLFNPDMEPQDPSSFSDSITAKAAGAVSMLEDDGESEIPGGNLELAEGTVAFTFVIDHPEYDYQALFGKDQKGDGQGDMSLYVHDGSMFLKIVDGGDTHYVSIPVSVEAGQAHDFALSFGESGLQIWFDGELVVMKPDMTVDWTGNDNDIVVGATNTNRDASNPDKISNEMQGEVFDFTVYDRALTRGEVTGLGRGATIVGGDGDENLVGTRGADAIYGGLDHDVLAGNMGSDLLEGGYGSDTLSGGRGSDVLDGGHGNDALFGGHGNDILISKADAREPVVAQLFRGSNGIPLDESGLGNGGATGLYVGPRARENNPRTTDPDNELDYETGKLYPDQPIPAEDVLTGGDGADIFRFQTVINAKMEIILKHVRDDGTINWGGVAGENNELHDHWVDSIGHDVITDFNRAEGDTIEIRGHTTQIASITYNDSDGDGIDDFSVIYLISNQGGNGGAHDQDLLGSITVYGDLLEAGDITMESMTTYGIVDTIDDLAEAITPLQVSDAAPRDMPGGMSGAAAPDRIGEMAGPSADAEAGSGAAPQGDGLLGQVWNSSTMGNLAEFYAVVAATDPTHQIQVTNLDLGGNSNADTLANFLGDDGSVLAGSANTAFDTIGLTLKGYIYIPGGTHSVSVSSDDGFALRLGGEDIISFANPRMNDSTTTVVNFGQGGLFEIELDYFESEGGQALTLRIDGDIIDSTQLYTTIDAYENGVDPDPDTPPVTNSGLDQILDWIQTDDGLRDRISDEDIDGGTAAAAAMNAIIIEAIKATGAANDGAIDAGDTYDIANWINANKSAEWLVHHGDDEDDEETGFHLVQNDGGAQYVYGENAINTVADAIYHLGFGTKEGRLINEDGNKNERVEEVAYWLNDLLEDELADGSLANPDAEDGVEGTTGTGLDALVDVIMDDAELNRRIPDAEQSEGARAADAMNTIIIDSIKALGLANDGILTNSDVMALADHIKANHLSDWKDAHGDDESGSETGFHLAQNDGATTRMFGRNAVNDVADGIFHLGFGYNNGRLINEDGKSNATVEDVAYWLNQLLVDDMGALTNASVDPTFNGTTGTGLDDMVDIITEDNGLNDRISLNEINEGAAAANTMNAIIIEGIRELGLANDGTLKTSETYLLSDWIRENHLNAWKVAHGDDENNSETGFHLVQNDGDLTEIFGEQAVDTIADGIYHLGFGYKEGRLINEDGAKNASVEDVTYWLNALLADDLADGSLANANTDPMPTGTASNGLDALIDVITDDAGLNLRINAADIAAGAGAANKMNLIITQGIEATGIANNGRITAADVRVLSDWIKDNHLSAWKVAHGDDETNVETGFHLVQNDGGLSRLYDEAAVNTVADGIYHLGFGYKEGRLINEDGAKNATLQDVAFWLEDLLAEDLESGSLANDAVNLYHQGTTGTGFDALVNMITTDEGLHDKLSSDEIKTAAVAADELGHILKEGIQETGIANSGEIDRFGLMELDRWVAENYPTELTAFHGNSTKTSATGFHIADIWYATSPLFGEAGITTIADAIYSIGFGVKYGDAILDQNGNWHASLDDIADWLNQLLDTDYSEGTMYNRDMRYRTPAEFADDIVLSLQDDVIANGYDGFEQVASIPELNTTETTVSFDFELDSLPHDGNSFALFSKDARDYGAGGHTLAYIHEGKLYVRVQNGTKSYYLSTPSDLTLQTGQTYAFALTIASDEIALFLDGEKVDTEYELNINWANNSEPLVIGGNGSSRNSGDLTDSKVYDVMDGVITDFAVYDRVLDRGEIAGLTGENADAAFNFMTGTANDDQMQGGDEKDIIKTGDGNDTADGSASDDELYGGRGNDTLYGGDGDDRLKGSSGNDKLYGGDGDDKLLGNAGKDRLNGGDGDDRVGGGEGNDLIFGGAGNDLLKGGTHNDRIFGGLGDDDIQGEEGNDKLLGNEGADTIYGGDGRDKLFGGDGNDDLLGGKGADFLKGGTGDDKLRGAGGIDRMYGGDGDDILSGGYERDDLRGDGGNDILKGDHGNDKLYGGDGADTLVGGIGNDRLKGGSGDDMLKGGADNDVLYGGRGNDLLSGGQGEDIFVIMEKFAHDTVLDLEQGVDVIDLSSFGLSSFADDILGNATDVTGGVEIDLGNGDALTIANYTASDLSSNDFIL